jgi:hypothetical protein
MMHMCFAQKKVGLISILVLMLSGCSPWGSRSQDKPPIFIIAVESLSFENTSCFDETGEPDGFQELCDSALRFTHFYTPSTMSQSSLASLLTGLDAAEHKVFHNGNDGIAPPVVTLAEKALLAGYRTAFFSGGPPFLAKSGFQQGYETFDDDFDRSSDAYTAASVLLARTLSWIAQGPQPTLTTVFLADMQFPFVQTYTDEKKEREKSVTAQRQEIAESLGEFFRQLKKQRLWDRSFVILVGLNGEAPMNRRSFLWRENVFRENVHVPLFIKTPQMKEAKSVDFLLSMKNIGQLLRDSLEQSTSMVDFVMQKMDEWKESPPTFLEIRSDWARWWMAKSPLVSLRTADYLVVPQKRWQIYHTLVDKNEGTVLFESQLDHEKIRWLKSKLDQSYDLQSYPSEAYDFMKDFRNAKMSGSVHWAYDVAKVNKSHYADEMAANEALRTENWERLKGSTYPLHRYLAARHLESATAVTLTGACERFFVEKPRENLFRRCRDTLFLALLDWERHRGEASSSQWEKNFIRQYRSYMKAKQMVYANIYLELNWDVDSLSYLRPSLAELYLHLPEKMALRKKVESYQIPLSVGFAPGML